MIKVQLANGDYIWINPAYIKWITENLPGCSVIMSDDDCHPLNISAEELIELIYPLRECFKAREIKID